MRGRVARDGNDRPVEKSSASTREAVAQAWLLNPLLQTLEVLALRERCWMLVGTYEGDWGVRAEPFDAVELELGALWV